LKTLGLDIRISVSDPWLGLSKRNCGNFGTEARCDPGPTLGEVRLDLVSLDYKPGLLRLVNSGEYKPRVLALGTKSTVTAYVSKFRRPSWGESCRGTFDLWVTSHGL
jgi:hypothetical protein